MNTQIHALTSTAVVVVSFHFSFLFVCFYFHSPFGCSNELLDPPPKEREFALSECRLGLFNREAWNLYWDVRTLLDMHKGFPKNSFKSLQALRIANSVVNSVEPNDPSTFAEGKKITEKYLSQRNGEGTFNVFAVGHCHIDTGESLFHGVVCVQCIDKVPNKFPDFRVKVGTHLLLSLSAQT